MLYVYFGNDTESARTRARTHMATLNEAGYAGERIEPEQYVSGYVAEAAAVTSLFGGHTVYLLDNPDQQETFWHDCIASREDMASSEHVFILLAGPLPAAEKKQLQSVAADMVETKTTTERFNTFALSNALADRDKKQLWLLLHAARSEGVAGEEVIGVLWWQLKTMLLAGRTHSAEEAGLKSFPYQKATRALRNFRPGEVERLASALLAVYHDGHAGERDLAYALEEWVLTI